MKLSTNTISDVMDTIADGTDNEELRVKNLFMWYKLIFTGGKTVKGVKFSPDLEDKQGEKKGMGKGNNEIIYSYVKNGLKQNWAWTWGI